MMMMIGLELIGGSIGPSDHNKNKCRGFWGRLKARLFENSVAVAGLTNHPQPKGLRIDLENRGAWAGYTTMAAIQRIWNHTRWAPWFSRLPEQDNIKSSYFLTSL